MYLAKILKQITAEQKHGAYQGKRVFVVQPIRPDGTPTGGETVAMDYVGSGINDIVVCGGAPGVARDVFKLQQAPIRTLIMAIVDELDYRDD
ncbi:MAG: EutN/CcmL family microcompartment protein [candidate division KSB1 bacterium]|nr:EutN/CcmL family microcompartment protein [candidate division KSB1 bacterium]